MNQPPEEHEEVILRLISAALEMRDQGLEPPLEEICAGRTELIPQVAEAIGLAGRLPQLQTDLPGHDSFRGQVLAERYRLGQRLGAGSMGVVYRAVDEELQRDVAIKLLRSEILSEDEAGSRFEREAEVLAALRHPGVVAVFDRGSTENLSYLVMELLDGAPLSLLLDEAKTKHGDGVESTAWVEELLGCSLPDSSFLRTCVRWTMNLASGLGAAHAAGIIHRDVKPSNVFIRNDGRPALIDFGIAAREDHATLMRHSGALGTPAYMAPEALNPSNVPGPALDVYSLCATLYHLVTFRAPYSGSPSQVISTLARKDPPRATRLRPGLPRDLQAILERGMARNPAQRYASAVDLEADLRAFLEHRPIQARSTTVVELAWRRMSRSAAFRGGTAVALLLLALWAGLAWRESDRARRSQQQLEVWSHLPASLGLWSPATRNLGDSAEGAKLADLLDRSVDLAVHPLPAHLIRAAFRLDQGDPRGAAQDMAAIAEFVGSPYTRGLAERYAQLPEDANQATALDEQDLPELSHPLDRYVAAYQTVRTQRTGSGIRAACGLLEHEGLAEFPAAQVLLLTLKPNLFPKGERDEDDRRARIEAFRELHDAAIRLEERLGLRTAETALVIGSSLNGQERYEEAVEPLREGLALTSSSYSLYNGLGIALRRVGELEEARDVCQSAIALRPGASSAYETLARVHIALHDYEAAEEAVANSPLASRRMGRELLAEIEFGRTLFAFAGGEKELARERAQRALDAYERAGEKDLEKRTECVVCMAIVDGDRQRAFRLLAGILEDEPSNWARLRTLIRIMPQDLDADSSKALRELLRAVERHFAPH